MSTTDTTTAPEAAADQETEDRFNELPEGPDRSLSELAETHDPFEPEDDGRQQMLDFGGQIDLKIKGKRPTDSEIKVKAISTPVNGQLGDLGDDEVVTFIGRARVDQIQFVTKRDGDGKVISKSRRHVLTPISFLPVDASQVEHLLDDDGGV